MGIEKRLIEDANLTRGMQLATPERITKVIRDVLKGEVGARVKVYEQTCMRCGACAKACHFSLSHPDDASYTPVAKLDKTIFKMVRESGKLNAEQMRGIAQIAHTECNMCRRCIHYCPVGVDIAYLMSLVRRICNKLGITPTFIQDTANSHSATFNQMWVREDEWIDSLVWQEEEAREEFPGIRIPLDKEGADFMYSVIAPEPKFRTQLIYQAAADLPSGGQRLDHALPPRLGQQRHVHVHGRLRNDGRIKRAHFELAQKLRVKRIVMGECGHAFRSVYDQGNRWARLEGLPGVPVVHAIEFYWELINEGKIKITHQFEDPVTIHDPCNTIRGRGPCRQAARRGALPLRQRGRNDAQPRAQLLLQRGRRDHQLRPALQERAHGRQPGESRSAPQHRSPHRGRPVPQLPRRTGRHHQALQARHAHQVHRRPHL